MYLMKLLEKQHLSLVLYVLIIFLSVIYYFYLFEALSNDFLDNLFYLLGSGLVLSILMIFFIEKPFKYFFIAISITFLVVTGVYFLFYLWMIALASAF